MANSVEDPFVQWHYRIFGKSQVQILQRGGQEFLILMVNKLKFVGILSSLNASETTVWSATMPVDGLCHLPGIVPVLLLMSEAPQDKVTFSEFGAV